MLYYGGHTTRQLVCVSLLFIFVGLIPPALWQVASRNNVGHGRRVGLQALPARGLGVSRYLGAMPQAPQHVWFGRLLAPLLGATNIPKDGLQEHVYAAPTS